MGQAPCHQCSDLSFWVWVLSPYTGEGVRLLQQHSGSSPLGASALAAHPRTPKESSRGLELGDKVSWPWQGPPYLAHLIFTLTHKGG